MAKRNRMAEFERMVLLSVSRLSANAYGMRIRQDLTERLERDISIGAVYTTLQRMTQKGFVSSWMGDPTPERGGRAKMFFKIEALGYKAYNESLDEMRDWIGDAEPLGGGVK